MIDKQEYTILLFYKYVTIDDPKALTEEQRLLCTKLDLKGRAIIASEGINATFEGKTEDIEEYCKQLISDSRFSDVHLKKSSGNGNAFPKLSIKVRKEIVTLGLPTEKDINPNKITGKYLSPEDLDKWFSSGKKFKIVDMRNDYEHKVGHFKDSILPPLTNFRDLPKVLPSLEPIKDETILTVCTGGVRCEKASGYLVENGFSDVYQLQGGIVSYMEKFEHEKLSEKGPANNFLGSLYVFDKRVTMSYASADKRVVISNCAICDTPSENYINCADNFCHIHFIACKNCYTEGMLCPTGDHSHSSVATPTRRS